MASRRKWKDNIRKRRKTILIAASSILAALVLIVGGYAAYVIAAYERIPDNQTLEIAHATDTSELKQAVPVGELRSIMTYNVGFGAYSADYSFFMDGGKHSWAFNEEAVTENIGGAISILEAFQPDFMCLQEVDTDSTRSYHINESELFLEAFPEYDSAFAYNYLNSPFLMWPLTEPHGTINSGVVTYSRYQMESSLRRSLPVMDNLNRFVDLDRCYTITRVPVENGAELCIFNVHLSAYGNDGDLRARQVGMLMDDMEKEYIAGNYVICAGDFNHDLKLKEDAEVDASWAQPFPRSMMPEGFSLTLDMLDEDRVRTMPNSCRDAGEPYALFKTKTYTPDGFIISDNIEMVDVNTVGNDFAYSDHNPVVLYFILK